MLPGQPAGHRWSSHRFGPRHGALGALLGQWDSTRGARSWGRDPMGSQGSVNGHWMGIPVYLMFRPKSRGVFFPWNGSWWILGASLVFFVQLGPNLWTEPRDQKDSSLAASDGEGSNCVSNGQFNLSLGHDPSVCRVFGVGIMNDYDINQFDVVCWWQMVVDVWILLVTMVGDWLLTNNI